MAFISLQQQEEIRKKIPRGMDASAVFDELTRRGNQLEGYSGDGTNNISTSTRSLSPGISDDSQDQSQNKDGFIKGTIKSLLKPISTGIASGARAIQATPDVVRSALGNREAAVRGEQTLEKPVNLPFVGKTKTLANMNEVEAGALALQTGANLLSPAAGGAIGSLGNAIEEKKSLKETALDTVGGFLLGKYGGKVLGKAYEYLPKSVKGSMTKLADYGDTALAVAAEKTGANKVIDKASELATTAAAKPARSLFGLTNTKVGKALIGDDLAGSMSELGSNPLVQAFRDGKVTYQDVANKAAAAAKDFSERSFSTFQGIKQSLPGLNIGKKTVNQVVNPILSGGSYLNTEEERLVGKLKSMITSNKNWTDKGVLNLRSNIDRAGFFRDGVGDAYSNSNRIVTQVRQALNGLVIEKHPFVADALENASKDIELMDQFELNVLGKNPKLFVERTASKLATLSKKLDDPAQLKATKELFQTIEDRTGFNITNDLQAAVAANNLQKGYKWPGITQPLESAKTGVKRSLVNTATRASDIVRKADNIKKINQIRRSLQ